MRCACFVAYVIEFFHSFNRNATIVRRKVQALDVGFEAAADHFIFHVRLRTAARMNSSMITDAIVIRILLHTD